MAGLNGPGITGKGYDLFLWDGIHRILQTCQTTNTKLDVKIYS